MTVIKMFQVMTMLIITVITIKLEITKLVKQEPIRHQDIRLVKQEAIRHQDIRLAKQEGIRHQMLKSIAVVIIQITIQLQTMCQPMNTLHQRIIKNIIIMS